MPLRTPLYDWHATHGGRMVEFGGWDMPVQYSTIVEEHTAVRTAAGLFDISHMGRLSFAGTGALDLLQYINCNNIATMKEFQVRYGLVLNEQGGVRDDVLVYRWPYGYAMVVNASNRDKILGWLDQHKTNYEVQITDQTSSTSMIAVQGPKAMDLVRGVVADDLDSLPYYYARTTRYGNQPCVVSRTGYTGEDGVEFMVPAALGVKLWEELVQRGAKPCGLGARDTLRLEAAMPLYGHELTEEIDPLQAGLGWAVKMDKGAFLGQDALRCRQQDGTRRVRVGLELEGKRIAREGAEVLAGDKVIGQVTSGTFAPTLEKAVAMAYVAPSHAAAGTPCTVDVRGKPASARVAPLPFYRRPKA
jgi:aminomethyltransferase